MSDFIRQHSDSSDEEASFRPGLGGGSFGVWGSHDNEEGGVVQSFGGKTFIRGAEFVAAKNPSKGRRNSGEGGSASGSGDEQRQSRSKERPDAEFANFADDIGARLMQQMGYKMGEGLGKYKQGIVNPIKAKLRPTKMGLAYSGFEERTEQAKVKQQLAQQESSRKRAKTSVSEGEAIPRHGDELQVVEDAETLRPSRMQNWKKDRRKRRDPFREIEDTIRRGKAKSLDNEPTTIVDMTGSDGPKIWTDMKSAYSSNDGGMTSKLVCQSSKLRELRFNLRILRDVAKSELESNVLGDKKEKERLDRLRSEKMQVQFEIERQESLNSRMHEVHQALKRFSKCLKLSKNQQSWFAAARECLTTFVEHDSPDMDKLTRSTFSTRAASVMSQTIQMVWKNWDIEEEPGLGLREVCEWKGILEVQQTSLKETQPGDEEASVPETHTLAAMVTRERVLETEREDPVLVTIFRNHWLPIAQRSLTNKWDGRDPDFATSFVKLWSGAVPESIMRNLLTCVILPKITLEVDKWNPSMDKQPVEEWIHPWFLHLGDSFEDTIFPTIRNKYVKVLRRWNPLDPSAKAILEPWYGVWRDLDWQKLMNIAILPRMADLFKSLIPSQFIAALSACIDWTPDLVAPARLVEAVLEPAAFPAFHRNLRTLLDTDPGMVAEWYQKVKEAIPSILMDSCCEAAFARGVDIMSSYLTGRVGAVPGETVGGTCQDLGSHQSETLPGSESSFADHREIPEVTSVRELLEYTAEKHGLVLIPLAHGGSGQRKRWRLSNEQKRTSQVLEIQEDVVYVQVKNREGSGAEAWRAIRMSDLPHL